MDHQDERLQICEHCVNFRHDGPLYEWCAAKDDNRSRDRNCSRSKFARFSARVARQESTCGLWNRQSIYLPDVPTFVHTTAWQTARHERVRGILGQAGFSNWRFIYGEKSDPYWINIPAEHAAILRSHEAPLLMLEDDIWPRAYAATIRPPADAEMVYLGAGKSRRNWGVQRAMRAWRGHPVRRIHQYCALDIDATWMRIAGMLYTHAILYLDTRIMRQVADLITSTGKQIDVSLAREIHRWNVVARKVPMWWQNDGRHKDETYDYWYPPQEGQAAEKNAQPADVLHETRAQRLRRERQQLLGAWKAPEATVPAVAAAPARTFTTLPDGTWIRCTR